jgi:hypothetical protein
MYKTLEKETRRAHHVGYIIFPRTPRCYDDGSPVLAALPYAETGLTRGAASPDRFVEVKEPGDDSDRLFDLGMGGVDDAPAALLVRFACGCIMTKNMTDGTSSRAPYCHHQEILFLEEEETMTLRANPYVLNPKTKMQRILHVASRMARPE